MGINSAIVWLTKPWRRRGVYQAAGGRVNRGRCDINRAVTSVASWSNEHNGVDAAAALHQLQVKRLSCGCRSGPALTRADRGRHASFGRPLRLQSATLQTTRVSAVAGCRRGTAQTTWLEGDCLLTCLGTCLLACLHPNQRYPKWFMCTRFRRSATRRTKHFVERQRVHRTIVDSTMCHCHLRSSRAHFRNRFNSCKHDRKNSCRAPTRMREFL